MNDAADASAEQSAPPMLFDTLRTASMPMRVIALRTSAIARPEGFIATELAMRTTFMLINGSASTNRARRSIVSFGSFSAFLTWKVMSRKVGNETCSLERSRAMSSRMRKLISSDIRLSFGSGLKPPRDSHHAVCFGFKAGKDAIMPPFPRALPAICDRKPPHELRLMRHRHRNKKREAAASRVFRLPRRVSLQPHTMSRP